MDKETHCFRLVAHLDNVTKDTLEEKTENDDIVVETRLISIESQPKIIVVVVVVVIGFVVVVVHVVVVDPKNIPLKFG